MEIMESSLAREINLITNNPPTGVTYYWTAEIHANGQIIPVTKVLSIDLGRDYESKYTDEMLLQVTLGGGVYAYRVYPFLNNLDITLYQAPLNEVSGEIDIARSVSSERFTATIIDPVQVALGSNGVNQPDEFSLDLTNMLTLNFQLVNKVMEQARMRSVGGNYRKTTVGDVIKTVLTRETAAVEIQDSNNQPLGVELIPPTNTQVREHVILPQGTKLMDVPHYIHQFCGGVYGTGLAYFYQDRHWYVFSPYDSSRFEQSTKTLTIIRMPSNRMPGLERTFRKDGNNTVILATGDTMVKNDSEVLALNKGNGVRFADADKFMGDGVIQVLDNKAVASRGGTNNEFTATQRPNGNQNVMSSQSRITANPYWEYSKLAARDGSLIGLTWENSDPSLILPGMPVKILYLEGENIQQTFGLIIKTHHYTQTRGKGLTLSRHFTTSHLTIFAKRELASLTS